MNLQQLRSLVAIYENNSFSAAADKVSLSHSAISLQIRTLEEEFGQKLFDRSTRPATLTLTGKATALAAQKALKMVNTVKLIGKGQQHTRPNLLWRCAHRNPTYATRGAA